MVTLPFMHHSAMALHSYGGLGFLQEHSWLRSSSLLSPQAVSVQPKAVLSLGLLSKHHIPAPSPYQQWQTPVSGWGAQGCDIDYLCKSHSVLPATDQLLLFPLTAPKAPLLSQLISPVRGHLWV